MTTTTGNTLCVDAGAANNNNDNDDKNKMIETNFVCNDCCISIFKFSKRHEMSGVRCRTTATSRPRTTTRTATRTTTRSTTRATTRTICYGIVIFMQQLNKNNKNKMTLQRRCNFDGEQEQCNKNKTRTTTKTTINPFQKGNLY